MNRLLLSFLLALSGLLALPASAQTSTVPIHVVVDGGAAYVISQRAGYTSLNAWVTSEVITRTNQIFTNTGINVQVSLAGVTSSVNVCCSPSQQGWGTMDWVKNSIPIQSARDNTAASMVVVITNFDANLEPYSTRSGCGGSGGTPENAIAGFAIGAQNGRDIASLAIGTALCINPQGYIYRNGTNPGDCEAAVTAEMASTNYNNGINFTNWTATCWQTSQNGQCFGSGHAAIVGIATAAGWQNCTYSNGVATGTQWTETMGCPFVGASNYTATYGTTTTSFVCNNITRRFHFSSPNVYYKGVAMGDSTFNNASLLTTQAASAKNYWQTKTAPRARAAAQVPVEAVRN